MPKVSPPTPCAVTWPTPTTPFPVRLYQIQATEAVDPNLTIPETDNTFAKVGRNQKTGYYLVNDHIDGWNMPMFNR